MVKYRVTTDEGEQLVVAARLRRDGERLAFLTGNPSSPQVVHDVDAARVRGLKRRITELNGAHRWITEPVPALDGPGRVAR